MSSQKALKERGIDQMLEEARADNKENDAKYLKPNIRPSCAYFNNLHRTSANNDVEQRPWNGLFVGIASALLDLR